MEALLFVFVGFGIIVGFVASDRGRSGIGYFFLSIIVSPFLAIIILLILPDLAKEARLDRERQDAEQKRDVQRQRDHEKQLEALRALKTEPASTSSTADELAKLSALLKDGVLTQAEFDDQKRRLLGG